MTAEELKQAVRDYADLYELLLFVGGLWVNRYYPDALRAAVIVSLGIGEGAVKIPLTSAMANAGQPILVESPSQAPLPLS